MQDISQGENIKIIRNYDLMGNLVDNELIVL
jgi:hypothetical protein